MSQPGWVKEAEAVCATLQKMKLWWNLQHVTLTIVIPMSNPVLTWDEQAASTVWTTFKTCKHTCQDHLILEGSGKGSNSTFRKASAAWILFVSPATVLSWKKWSEFIQFLHSIFEKYGVFFLEMACKSTAKRSLFSRPSKSRQHQQHASKITRFLSQRRRHQLSAKRHRTGLPPFFSHLWRATYSGWVCLTCFWAFWSAWHTAFSPLTRRFCAFIPYF